MDARGRSDTFNEFEILAFHSMDPRKPGPSAPVMSTNRLSFLPESSTAESWIVLQDVNTGQRLTNQIANMPGLTECLKDKTPSLQPKKHPDKFIGTRIIRQQLIAEPYVKYTWKGELPSKRWRRNGGS